ncbi:MAG: antitoxin Xre/MbcA/ParS toxin-binding domain-containing protein [Motiliproteus sp.]
MTLDEARQRLFEAAIGYFGSKEAADQWLDTPHMGLGCTRPRDLLKSTEGIGQLMQVISQLEQGDTA